VKLQEYHAKSLLSAAGLPVPPYGVARSPEEARALALEQLAAGTERVVVKAQVLVGGRGKAGGVRLAGSADEAETVARQILGMDLKGIPVRTVLVAPAADIVKEFYLGAVLDRASRRILLMEGFFEARELAEIAQRRLAVVVHEPDQLRMLEAAVLPRPIEVFVKVNSGMNRLGFAPGEVADVCRRLASSPGVAALRIMTHLARADEDAAQKRELEQRRLRHDVHDPRRARPRRRQQGARDAGGGVEATRCKRRNEQRRRRLRPRQIARRRRR
jgi:hypothetical protein